MPDYDVIADVSTTLENVLTAALSTLTPAPSPIAQIHDLHGVIPTAPARLTIFLYDALEDSSARNRPRVRDTGPPLIIRKPPMALMLRYLLTPWGGDRLTEYKILGRAMQVLYDQAILSGPQLAGGLALTDQALKITLAPLNLEERTRVWYSVQKPYRLSVSYEVRVVNLDTKISDQSQAVNRRALDYAEPETIS